MDPVISSDMLPNTTARYPFFYPSVVPSVAAMEPHRTFHELAYEDQSTPQEMYGDCAAAGARLHVPTPRRTPRSHSPRLADLPHHRVVVDPAAARLAGRLFDGD